MTDTKEREIHNEALAHVILLEAALIEFRGQFLRHNADGMAEALGRFEARVSDFAAFFRERSQEQEGAA